MDFPKDLHYAKTHEWIKKSGDKVIIGITAFAVEQLGDITLVELPDVGTALDAESEMGTIESVKSVSDIYAPIAGTVSKINEELDDTPELVNEEPYGTGWFIEVTPSDMGDVDKLFDADAYAAFVAAED